MTSPSAHRQIVAAALSPVISGRVWVSSDERIVRVYPARGNYISIVCRERLYRIEYSGSVCDGVSSALSAAGIVGGPTGNDITLITDAWMAERRASPEWIATLDAA